MRAVLIIFILTSCLSYPSSGQQLTVKDVIERIVKELGTEIQPGSVDTLKSGNWEQPVTGIATTFMATMEVLKTAAASRVNLILTHEPTFYNHFDDKSDLGENDPVVRAKLDFIKQNNLVVFRYHDLPHQIEDDQIAKGILYRLGWEKFHRGDMVFNSPYQTLKELADFLKDRFSSSTVRVVGNPGQRLNTIAILPGAYGRHGQINKYNTPGIDALIVGESREWETVEYARDAQELGMIKALIVMGHADSEEPGMEYVAEWLESFITEVPVKFLPAGNPLWSPD